MIDNIYRNSGKPVVCSTEGL